MEDLEWLRNVQLRALRIDLEVVLLYHTLYIYTHYTHFLTAPQISFNILHCSALILLNAMKQSESDVDALRYLLHRIMNHSQSTESDGSELQPGHTFLALVRNLATRRPLIKGTSSSSAQFKWFSGSLPYCTGLRIITCMWISPHGDRRGVFAGQPRHQFLTDCQRNTYPTLTKGYGIT